MVHLRIVAPHDAAMHAADLLQASPSVSSVVVLEGAARKPEGDLILCDVAREDASVIIDDLRELDIPATGSISIEAIDSQISEAAERAVEHAPGLASDAVIWEDVENRSQELTELSATFLAFMVLSMLIAAVGILLDQPILIVGAMVVGPGVRAAGGAVRGARGAPPPARRGDRWRRWRVGFPLGIAVTVVATLCSTP